MGRWSICGENEVHSLVLSMMIRAPGQVRVDAAMWCSIPAAQAAQQAAAPRDPLLGRGDAGGRYSGSASAPPRLLRGDLAAPVPAALPAMLGPLCRDRHRCLSVLRLSLSQAALRQASLQKLQR